MMTRYTSAPLGIFLLFFGAACLLGCASPEKDAPLPLSFPEAFSESGSGRVPDRWWTAFEDPRLHALVDRALESNFDLKTAWQRLQEARAVVERESASLLPDAEGLAQGELSGGGSGTEERLRLGLTSSYELDLWGRIRSSIEAERFRAEATREEYQAAALSLAAEVALTWFRIAEARDEQDLLERQAATNETALRLLRARFAGGQIRAVDILRQRRLVEATQEQQLTVESRLQVLRHQLAVLLGRPPQQGLDAVRPAWPDIPPLPDIGLPVELIRRRPDVRSAYRRVQAADRDLAAAISKQYPRLNLTAALSTAEEGASRLFADWARSFSADLTAPLIDAGRRAAEVDRTEALKKQRLFEYGQAVLRAFQEVEDALIREQKAAQRIHSLEIQVRLAERAHKRLRTEYFNGVADFLDVLTARTEVQELRRNLLSARLQRLEERIGLYRSLAGGFAAEGEEDYVGSSPIDSSVLFACNLDFLPAHLSRR
jgi:NodT family efflux transporter outer membrane factor (OMF) lipoprotein